MSLTLFLAVAAAQASPSPAFEKAIDGYITCLVATVRIGMTTKMEPAIFAEGFAKSCMTEQQAFFDEAVSYEMTNNGKSKEAAEAQIGAQIAKGRAIYVADQANYIATGKVPK